MTGTKIKEDFVDVLIVGAGPAGLMLANWMSRTGVKTRIVDKRSTKIFSGQADGLQCRTLEILDSFDFGHRAWRESNHMIEICLWNPDNDGQIRRSDRIPDTIPGLSRFQQVVLHQGRIERFFLDSIRQHSDIEVERGVLPTSFEFEHSKAEDFDDYPITVTLQTLTEGEATPEQSGRSEVNDGLFRSNLSSDDTADLVDAVKLNARAGKTEIIKAKFMVGCDGAHSWVRKELGFKLEGDSTDYIWGVLDIIPVTDFPDIRMRCAIHSANNGSIMVIPRENKLVRLYIQLQSAIGASGAKVDRSWITPELILGEAQKIIAPYKLTYSYCDWWTAYQIGQRVGDRFSLMERVFLAGDAVHTHSPKAGQGMNVSMQDAYNLGWKIASVVRGHCDGSILKTYESERRGIAKQLIDFDYRFSRLFSGRPARDIMDEEGISMEEFKEAFSKGNRFASGVAVDYDPSLIVVKEAFPEVDSANASKIVGISPVVSNQELAAEIKVGMRIPSHKVLNQADARPWHLQELLKSDGRWRIILFPGDLSISENLTRLTALCKKLEQNDSFLHRFTPPDHSVDSVIEILTVHAAPRKSIELLDLPQILHPYSDSAGHDYWKVFVDDESYHEGHGNAYESYGICPKGGASVIVRPDQYVSWVGESDDYESMDRFFSAFMKAQ
ncbi:Phenol 2-monooxygenase [Penicillium brasilianum]|uniref:Phenol 2-monooxygenase n=1 Tax=Penicillium brasilianum TaxID=104259 RepID=A0A1S9RLU3_PENBI|nr:Phenol 2-monooxygenase [Penicillium brasilianum]